MTERRATRALQRLVEHAPSTGGLALWIGHRDVEADDPHGDPAAPACTDGLEIRYHPAFATLPLAQQTGVVAHELLHVALRHPQRLVRLRERVGDVDLRLFNVCADAIVNAALAHLAWLALPEGALRLAPLLRHGLGLDVPDVDEPAALAAWDLERLYRAVDDRAPPEPDGGAGRPRRDGPRAARVRALGGAQARDLLPAPGEATAPEADAEAARSWSERLARAHAADGPMSLLRTLLADGQPPHTPWDAALRTLAARALAPRPQRSWSRPSRSCQAQLARWRAAGRPPGRRPPFEPGHSAFSPAPRLVVVVDVSGSIEPPLLARFADELQALARRHGAALTLVLGDEAVQQVLVHDPRSTRHGPLAARLAALPTSAGGTDFRPLLAEAARHAPDLCVVLTDLDGPAGEPPPFPVLWAVPPAAASAPWPFGRRLLLAD